MIKKIKHILDFIFAVDEDFSLENRLFLYAMVYGILISLVGYSVSVFLTTSLIVVIALLVLAVFMIIIYYFIRFKKITKPFIIPVSLLTMVGIAAIWVFNGGLNGSNLMPAFVILILVLIIYPPKLKKYAVILFISFNTIAFLIQFYRPDLIVSLSSETERWFDSYITMIYTSVFMYLIIQFVHGQYTLERVKSEESEIRYQELVENSPEAIVIQVDGKIAYINKECIKLMAGKNANDLLGKSVFQFVHPFYREQVTQNIKKLSDNEPEALRNEEKLIRLDGSEVDVEVTAIAIRIDNKPALQLLIRNITEKKQAEETIRKTEERYRALVDNTFEGILIIDFEGKVLFANQSLIRTFEYESFEEIAGENVFRFIAPESVPQAITDLTNVVQGIEVEVANYAGITSKGNKIWFESLGKIIDYEGIKADIISVRDITAKKLAEEKLLENENRFRAITETANDAIVVSNDKGQIVFSNPSALKVFGYEESEFTGMSFEMIIPERFRTTHSEHFESFTHRHVPGTIGKTREFAAIKKDGNEFPMEISLSHWQTSAGVFVAANIRDITERKLAESELIHARDRAEESDRLKSAFLTNMSHEIRTPMNGILGFAELLKNPGLSGDQQQEYIRIIMKSGDRMLNIINDIVDISKIESGQVKVSLSATNINEQIEDIYILFKTQAEKKGLQMVFNNSLPATECILNTDQEKIYAILSNLVKNAIKYSDRGTIEFGYLPEYVSEKPGEPHSLKFYVKDNGIGIPVNRQKAIFDRFVQADIADKLAYQGAGLGLSISKAYVEMLGGQIWVESEESKGSAFYFIVPFTPAPAAKNTDTNDLTPEPASDQIKKLKVLIVEDDVTSEMLISLMIKSFSKEIISKTTGSEAVEACRNNPDLDLILMDIKMPDMDGYEATRKIREFNKEIIIIAQTAFGLSSDREKAIEAGCNDYISKPLNLAFLRELIQKHFENTN